MKKFFKWLAIFIILVFVYGIYESTNEKEVSEGKPEKSDNGKVSKNISDNENKTDNNSSLKLTEREKIIITSMLKDDFRAFVNGGEAQFKYDYIVTTAKKMFSVYNNNQVKGDTLFKNKNIIISGIVDSINSGFGDIPYVVLKAGDMFDGVHISFKRDYRTLAGNLNKGQKVTYVCIGDSVIVGTPTLKSCQPVSVVKDKIVDDEVKKISDSLGSKNPDKVEISLYSISAYMAILNEVNNNKCKDTDLECLTKLINTKGNKPEDLEKNNNLSEDQSNKLKNIKLLLKGIKQD